MRPDLSIIIPAYKSLTSLQEGLPLLALYLRELPISIEVFLVNDGNTEGEATREFVESMGFKYLENSINMGKGAAVRKGMLAATGRVRLFTDADLPYQLKSIEHFYRYVDSEKCHVVVGDRTLPDSDYFTRIPQVRSLGSKVFSFIVGSFFVRGLFDTQCGLKAFRGDVAEDLFSVARIDRFAMDVELFYIALKRDYVINRMPVRLRQWQASSIRMVKRWDCACYTIFFAFAIINSVVGMHPGRVLPWQSIRLQR